MLPTLDPNTQNPQGLGFRATQNPQGLSLHQNACIMNQLFGTNARMGVACDRGPGEALRYTCGSQNIKPAGLGQMLETCSHHATWDASTTSGIANSDSTCNNSTSHNDDKNNDTCIMSKLLVSPLLTPIVRF